MAEIQGLYGAFTFSEKLLQKIWLRRGFDHGAARTTDGRRVRVVHPGRWNLLGGPDFREARVQLCDGPELVGDVELHLRASDWEAHAHASDPAYDRVILHVVLFWPEPGYVTRARDGRQIPVLPLLPLLYHDLEEYAADEAVERLSNRPSARLTDELAGLAPEVLRGLLERQAAARWAQKVHFARLRVQRLGWMAACHHTVLEVLGFRYNRAPMLRLATRWPLAAWVSGEIRADQAFEAEAESWSVQGVRPANHPRARLRQYAAWVAHCPNWPERLRAGFGWGLISPGGDTRAARRANRLAERREDLARQLCGYAVAGSRLENLICDAFLPLLAAVATQPAGEPFGGTWFHWFCGDLPPFVVMGLRQLGVCDGRNHPVCHGLAQGLLAWLIEREVRR